MRLEDPFFKLDEIKKKHRRRTPKHDLEGAVLRECLTFLSTQESVVYIERRNTGAVQFEGGGFIRFGSKGAADIWCLVDCPLMKHYPQGRTCTGKIGPSQPRLSSCDGSCLTHVEIEAKRRDGKGRLSEDQKAFKQLCDKHVIPYFVVTSAADLGKQLHNAGLLA